ncbi:hypothetical protein D9M73_259670 [compost metagenome]
MVSAGSEFASKKRKKTSSISLEPSGPPSPKSDPSPSWKDRIPFGEAAMSTFRFARVLSFSALLSWST